MMVERSFGLGRPVQLYAQCGGAGGRGAVGAQGEGLVVHPRHAAENEIPEPVIGLGVGEECSGGVAILLRVHGIGEGAGIGERRRFASIHGPHALACGLAQAIDVVLAVRAVERLAVEVDARIVGGWGIRHRFASCNSKLNYRSLTHVGGAGARMAPIGSREAGRPADVRSRWPRWQGAGSSPARLAPRLPDAFAVLQRTGHDSPCCSSRRPADVARGAGKARRRAAHGYQ